MMNVNNNNNQYNTSFSNVPNGRKEIMTKDEKMNILVPKASNLLAQRAEREVPENGKFTKIFVAFDVPDTQNEALISIEADQGQPKDMRRLSIGVHRMNSDRITSNYMLKGTKREILDYLKKAEVNSEFIKTVYSLSDSVDDYYSSL